MTERRLQLQVGILFILSIVVLVWGILWFKDVKSRGTTYEIHVEFPNTSGLVKGDPVEVRGVTSGKVAEIVFEDARAIVTCRIDKDVVLYPGTRVTIENVGIMGQKVIAINPGPATGTPYPPGSELIGTYDSGLPQLMGDVSGTLVTFQRVAVRLDSLLASFSDEDRGRLERTLDNTERATGQLADVLEKNRDELASSIGSLNTSLAELQKALEGRGERLGEVIDGSARMMARIDTTLDNLDSAMSRVESIAARVESGEGTVGKLLQDPAVHDELRTTIEEVRALVADLRENPRKYFKVSVF